MNKSAKVAIVAVLVVAVIAVMTIKRNQAAPQIPSEYLRENLTGKGLPVLIDIGAETCIPCKMMAPILAELKTEYASSFAVHFFNLDECPDLASEYQIRVKPTQIFYDASGQELFRHAGFFAKEDILAKWQEFGVASMPE
jgi:thioredoxin 1